MSFELRVGLDHIQEELMNASIVAELWMKRCREQRAFANKRWIIATAGKDLNAFPDAADARCADKHHLHRSTGELGFSVQDG